MAAGPSSFTDNFDAPGGFNLVKWGATSSAGTVVTQENGQLTFTTSTTAGYASLGSNLPVDLTGDAVETQVTSAGNQGLTMMELYPVNVLIDANNSLFFLLTGNTLFAYKKVAGTSTSLASIGYSAAQMQWLRIRESAGTTYWEYSPDGFTWKALFSAANPIVVTSLQILYQVGTFSTPGSGTVVRFDNAQLSPMKRPQYAMSIRPHLFSPGFSR